MTVLNNDKLVARILNRRGNRINLPQPLEPGEIGWCLDTKQIFVGLDSQNSIAAIQTYNGVTDAQVNDILSTDVIMFSTPYIRLLTPAAENITNSNPHEKNALDQLAEIAASSFLLENNRYAISSLESKIRIINQIRTSLPTFIGSGNYPVTYLYDWQTTLPAAATATATVALGEIDVITVTYDGIGYLNGETPLVTVTGDGVGAIVTALVVDGVMQLTYTPASGSGYTTATLTIDPPATISGMTPDLYSFNFIVGVENNFPSMAGLITDLNTDPAFIFVQTETDLGYPITFTSPAALASTAPYSYVVASGVEYFSSVRAATNMAGIINKLSDPTGNGLVTTKQNVELLTEYSVINGGGPIAEVALNYRLPASPIFTNIENDGSDPLYSSATLSFDVTTNNIQKIQYSISDFAGLILREGTLSVKTLSTGVAVLDDDYNENRDVSVLAPPAGPDFSFSYTYSLGMITLTYKHNFATDALLRTFTKQWISYLA